MYWSLQKIYTTDDIYVQEFSRSWDLCLLILGFGTGCGQYQPPHFLPMSTLLGCLQRLKAGRPCCETEAQHEYLGVRHGVS